MWYHNVLNSNTNTEQKVADLTVVYHGNDEPGEVDQACSFPHLRSRHQHLELIQLFLFLFLIL